MNSSPIRSALLIAGLAVAVVAFVAGWRFFGAETMIEPPLADAPLPAPCRDVLFEGDDFIACAVDDSAYRIVLAHENMLGQSYRSLANLAGSMPFALAMNAGMYHEDNSPVGLYVERGKQYAPLNRTEGEGNFFLKPNGVFFIDNNGKPGLMETTAFSSASLQVDYATQSGPMLVINGAIHPKFEPDGQSRYIRNGVGIDSQGKAVFAISRAKVSLGKFARLFRDGLDCGSALFFDGAISALHDGSRYIVGGEYPVGPIVAVTVRANGAEQVRR